MNVDTELSNPILLTEVAGTVPHFPLWLGHAGAPMRWDEALEVAHAGPKVRLEMSVWLRDDSNTDAELGFAGKVLEAGEEHMAAIMGGTAANDLGLTTSLV